jgi:plastocyanin
MDPRRAGRTLIFTGFAGLVALLLLTVVISWPSRDRYGPWGGWWGWMGPMHEWMDQSSDAPPPPPPPSPGSREVSISAGEFYFNPNRIELSRDETVTVVLTNEGRLPHDFTLPAIGVSVPVLAGSTTRAGIRPLSPGTWEFYCSIPGHREAGMTGLVVVS